MGLTVEQVEAALDSAESFARMAQIPGTSIDDYFREGLAKLQEVKDARLIDIVVKFLNYTPLFSCSDDPDCQCDMAVQADVLTENEAKLIEDHQAFLTSVRNRGNYQFC